MFSTDRKRRGNKKNKLDEIQKPRGFDRNLEIDRIVGSTDCTGSLLFLIKWMDCDEFDLLPATEVNTKSPLSVIQFYEQKSEIVRKCEEKRKICEKYEQDLLEHPVPADLEETVDAPQEAVEEITTEEEQISGGTVTETPAVETTANEEVEVPDNEPAAVEDSHEIDNSQALPDDIEMPAADDY